jgi:hypothetical protein
MSTTCAIYCRPANEYHLSKEWGGCHITLAGFQPIASKQALQKISKIATEGFNQGNGWHPTDYSIAKWNNRWTVVINSKTLRCIVQELKNNGFKNLKGPDDCKVAFHVTLPESIKNKSEEDKYAKKLVAKEWFLSVAQSPYSPTKIK